MPLELSVVYGAADGMMYIEQNANCWRIEMWLDDAGDDAVIYLL